MTENQKVVLTVGLVGLSFLPIWRCVGGTPGMNLWEYGKIAFLRAPGSYPHIPAETAIENARQAYCEVRELNYETIYSDYPISRRIGAGVPCGV